MADFVFHFCTTCLKIHDLSEVEKMDRFVCALVPKVRLQVELRGPLNFHKATMYTECADTVIMRVSSQDMRKQSRRVQKGDSRNVHECRYSKELKPVRKVHQILNRWN